MAAVAEIFRIKEFPIGVQTLWEGNERHRQLIRMGTDKETWFINREFGIDIRSPEDAAFDLCIRRCGDHIEEKFAGTKWEVSVDAGKRKPGHTMSAAIKWSGSDLICVHFKDSEICRLIQLDDCAAYFPNRSQQIAHVEPCAGHEEELLDMLGPCFNFVKIDYEIRPRQHAV